MSVTIGDLPNGFYVEDTGPKISPERRETVLESGYSTSPEGRFGLAVVDEIAASHG